MRLRLKSRTVDRCGFLSYFAVEMCIRDREITGEALVSAERLGRLEKHTRKVLEEICRELAAGKMCIRDSGHPGRGGRGLRAGEDPGVPRFLDAGPDLVPPGPPSAVGGEGDGAHLAPGQ